MKCHDGDSKEMVDKLYLKELDKANEEEFNLGWERKWISKEEAEELYPRNSAQLITLFLFQRN